jgi:hypothetical protein
MPNLRLELPPGHVVINTDKITPNKMEKLSEVLGEIRLKHSPFSKYPMEDDETYDQWAERVNPKLIEANKKKEGEKTEDYLKRLYKVELDKKEIVFDTLLALACVFDQGKAVTEEAFGNGSYTQMKGFVRDVLKSCDFDVKDYE